MSERPSAFLAPFKGPRLKIRRAEQHINALRSLAHEFGQRVHLQAIPVEQGETHTTWRFTFTECAPTDMSIFMGDAIHNLRAALDILMCDIARLRGKSTDNVNFPFAENAEALETRLNKRAFRRIGEDVCEALRRLSPFKGGNIGLRGLHDLDILDKHEIVVPVFLVAKSKVSWFQQGHPVSDILRQHFKLDFSQTYAPVTEATTLHLRNDIDPRSVLVPLDHGPQPMFAPGLPFAGELMVETLEKLLLLTSQIIDLFDSQFGGGDLESGAKP